MSADGKWIDGLSPTMPIHRAAEIVFSARLETVTKCWNDALDNLSDAEAIHQFRVATRRASAALQSFGNVMKESTRRRLRKKLKRMRTAAGAARDCDVYLARLKKWSADRPPDECRGLDLLAGVGVAGRIRAYAEFADKAKSKNKWDRLLQELNVTGQWHESLGKHASVIMPELSREFQQAAEAGADDDRLLHAIRIAGKRLRYAVELFADCYGPAVREEIYPLLEELQEILGDAHDAAVIDNQVGQVLDVVHSWDASHANRFVPGILAWREHLQCCANDGAEQFRAWNSRWSRGLAANAVIF